MDDDATFSRFFNSWLLGDDSATADYRDFGLAGDEYRVAISPNVVDVLCLVATLYTWTDWWTGVGNDDCRVGRDWIGFVGGAKIITRVDTGVDKHTGGHGGPPLRIKFVFMPIDNIIFNVFPDSVQIMFVTDNVFIIITLPQFFVE